MQSSKACAAHHQVRDLVNHAEVAAAARRRQAAGGVAREGCGKAAASATLQKQHSEGRARTSDAHLINNQVFLCGRSVSARARAARGRLCTHPGVPAASLLASRTARAAAHASAGCHRRRRAPDARTGADSKSKVPVKVPGPGGNALSANLSRPATSGAYLRDAQRAMMRQASCRAAVEQPESSVVSGGGRTGREAPGPGTTGCPFPTRRRRGP